MAPYRILVVDDSAFMRKIFSDIINGDPEFTVVGTAANGTESLERQAALKPDAITMDLEMPEMNGIDALKRIMMLDPTPVIMLSGISEASTRETIRALHLGAIDFIRKPNIASLDIKAVGEQLLSRLRVAVTVKRRPVLDSQKDLLPAPARPDPPPGNAKANPGTGRPPSPSPKAGKPKPAAASRGPTPSPEGERPPGKAAKAAAAEQPGKAVPTAEFRDIIAIGTSTGGPRALHEVLTALPANLKAPVLVVQHMPPKFTYSLAQRLDSFAKLNIREAVQHERIQAGVVYIAPGGMHMALDRDAKGFRIRLSEDELRGGHRPSVDVLFESMLPHGDLKRHVVVMTGMGSDGAAGMKALTEQGIPTAIAEAEETCVVYGMPRSAVERGGATAIVPLQDIAPRLVDAVMK